MGSPRDRPAPPQGHGITSKAASRLAWASWIATVALLVATGSLAFLTGQLGADVVFLPLILAFLLAFSTVGALVAARLPGNAIGWIFCATGLAWVLASFADSLAAYAVDSGRTASTWAQIADWVNLWFYGAAIFLPVTLLLLLFPDGRLPSRRWRPFLWLAFVGNVGLTLTTAFDPSPEAIDTRFLRTNPYGLEGATDVLDLIGTVSWITGAVALVAAPVAIVIRLRRSTGDERGQLKWLAYAGVVVVLTLVGAIVAGSVLGWGSGSTGVQIVQFIIILSLTLIPVSAGVAILKHRLYDIDVVINKTVVYALLAGVVTAIYAAIVVGIGTAVGTRGDAFLSAVAAAIVALVFQPARRWAQHLANRLVYGKRATPYEVLSGFSGRLAETYSVDDVLPRIAHVLGEGVGAERVEILLRTGPRLVPVVSWPDAAPRVRSEQRSFTVRHQGELLGSIEVAMPANEPMNDAQEKLVEDVAAQAGLVLRNAALIADLRASRRRIVAAQDERAKKLERNIHDGAQQQLVALAVKVG